MSAILNEDCSLFDGGSALRGSETFVEKSKKGRNRVPEQCIYEKRQNEEKQAREP